MRDFETRVGLEVHVQLKTATKLFCGCRVAFGSPPNTLVCPVCSGQPGSLPVLNAAALRQSVTAALALGCAIATRTAFDRKNYFYPDLPKGYQITQLRFPVGRDGALEIDAPDGGTRRIGIARVQIEEDAGKTIHPPGREVSLVDLNRAGVPLLEIVTEPHISGPAEARTFLVALKQLMQYTGVSDCDMEKGSLRCDANVSVTSRDSAARLGTRCEIKNLNSFRNVERALAWEAQRHEKILRDGGRVEQETRIWREEAGETAPLRSKEEEHDYRYFPDPDLPPVEIPARLEADRRAALPELPRTRRNRLVAEYGLSPAAAAVLTARRETADFFEEAVRLGAEPRSAARWIQGPVLEAANARGSGIEGLPVRPRHIAGVAALVRQGRVAGQAAEKVVAAVCATGTGTEEALGALGLEQRLDRGALSILVAEVLKAQSHVANDYRRGKGASLNALVGAVLQAAQGRADPRTVRDLLVERLATSD